MDPSAGPELVLRDDPDEAARRSAARALADAVRPRDGSIFVELGDRHPEVAELLIRARTLPMQGDKTGVVWAGPSRVDGVWTWLVDALPFASYVEVRDGLDDSDPLVLVADDSLFSMSVWGPVERDDLRSWLTQS